jgi:hypothetical protein
MTEEIAKIYDFVAKMEDLYYSKPTEGKNLTSYMVMMAQASAFQRVRYFIEILEEEKERGKENDN